jgi:hypothetical protein
MNTIKDKAIEPYFINLDNGYVLNKVVQSSESDKTYERFIGHFTTLDNLIKAIAKDKTMERSYDTLKEYLKEYRQVVDNLNQVLC